VLSYADLVKEVKRLSAEKQRICVWKPTGAAQVYYRYSTACGILVDGEPMKYCGNCGGKVEEQ